MIPLSMFAFLLMLFKCITAALLASNYPLNTSCSHFLHFLLIHYASFGLYIQIAYEKLIQQMSKLEEIRESETNLMRHRINDLTVKLTSTETSLRQTQHRLSRSQERNSRLSRKTSSSTETMIGSYSSEKTTGTVHPMNKDDNNYLNTDSQDNCPELHSRGFKSSSDSKSALLETSSFMRDLCVVIESSHNEIVLTRLHDLSTSLRKISDSLNSACDSNKCLHRSASSSMLSEATKM
jgi:hypothetical protein